MRFTDCAFATEQVTEKRLDMLRMILIACRSALTEVIAGETQQSHRAESLWRLISAYHDTNMYSVASHSLVTDANALRHSVRYYVLKIDGMPSHRKKCERAPEEVLKQLIKRNLDGYAHCGLVGDWQGAEVSSESCRGPSYY